MEYGIGKSGIMSGVTIKAATWSPNYYVAAYPAKGICVHHAASTSPSGCDAFLKASRQASAHYYVGDGWVRQFVSEKDGAWHGGCDFANYGLIGIETMNSGGAPDWRVSDKTFDTLAKTMADIAYRHGWSSLKRGVNVYAHREMKAHGAGATACPGDYLYGRMDALVSKANGYLDAKKQASKPGWHKVADGKWKYMKASGSWAKSECLKIGDYWYAFGSDCYEIIGGIQTLSKTTGKMKL